MGLSIRLSGAHGDYGITLAMSQSKNPAGSRELREPTQWWVEHVYSRVQRKLPGSATSPLT